MRSRCGVAADDGGEPRQRGSANPAFFPLLFAGSRLGWILLNHQSEGDVEDVLLQWTEFCLALRLFKDLFGFLHSPVKREAASCRGFGQVWPRGR